MNAFTNQVVLINITQKCRQQENISKRLSTESHLYWKKRFQRNPMYFRFVVDFAADNEIDKSNIGFKSTNIFQTKPCI